MGPTQDYKTFVVLSGGLALARRRSNWGLLLAGSGCLFLLLRSFGVIFTLQAIRNFDRTNVDEPAVVLDEGTADVRCLWTPAFCTLDLCADFL